MEIDIPNLAAGLLYKDQIACKSCILMNVVEIDQKIISPKIAK